ncbi:MAG: ABC transporter permease [Gemmatimonadota bacterium]
MINLRLGFRTLAKTPFVTGVAIVSLALGIGANVAIFSLFDQMLLAPLPVAQPDQLVNLAAVGPKPGSQSCNRSGDCDAVFSYPMFRDLERAKSGFSGVAAHREFGASVAIREKTSSVAALFVSGSYFPVLGLKPALGRLFTPADDQTLGGHFVVVLGHSYWKTKLGSDPTVVNQTMIVNGQTMTIVGVAPRGFEGTTLGTRVQLFAPITMRAVLNPGFTEFENRRSYWIYVFARRSSGVSLAQAGVAINAVYRPIINGVEAALQKDMSAPTMAKFRAKQIEIEDGRRGQSQMHGQMRTPILMLFSITAIVLIIACANIANLLLARAASREMEITVRMALGSTRRHLLAQLLTESCLLGLLGGLASLVVANLTLSLMTALLPADLGTTLHFQLQLPAILFAALLSVGTGILFGLFPALNSTKPGLIAGLSAGSGKHSGARGTARFRAGLVTAQIALSTTLLISAGLFIKSLHNVASVDLGLRAENLLTFGISPRTNGYQAARSAALFSRVEEELAALPGVTGVTDALVPLLTGESWGTDVEVEGFKGGPDVDQNVRFNEVGAGYFRTLEIPILSGREFTLADGVQASKVAIVNEAFVKKFNLGREPVGKRISGNRGGTLDIEIVGLVKNAKYEGVKRDVPPLFFAPYRQDSTVGDMRFYIRSALEPEQLLRTIPAVIAKLDPNLPVDDLKTLPQQVRENVFMDRMISTLSAAFAALATLLAAVGLYGVLAYSVAQRTREIGIRMALGANGGRVRGMVLRQVGWMTVVGGAIGVAGAFALGKVAKSLLFGLEGQDPLLVTAALAILGLVAFGAGYIPALRASGVDPMQALRSQ